MLLVVALRLLAAVTLAVLVLEALQINLGSSTSGASSATLLQTNNIYKASVVVLINFFETYAFEFYGEMKRK